MKIKKIMSLLLMFGILGSIVMPAMPVHAEDRRTLTVSLTSYNFQDLDYCGDGYERSCEYFFKIYDLETGSGCGDGAYQSSIQTGIKAKEWHSVSGFSLVIQNFDVDCDGTFVLKIFEDDAWQAGQLFYQSTFLPTTAAKTHTAHCQNLDGNPCDPLSDGDATLNEYYFKVLYYISTS